MTGQLWHKIQRKCQVISFVALLQRSGGRMEQKDKPFFWGGGGVRLFCTERRRLCFFYTNTCFVAGTRQNKVQHVSYDWFGLTAPAGSVRKMSRQRCVHVSQHCVYLVTFADNHTAAHVRRPFPPIRRNKARKCSLRLLPGRVTGESSQQRAQRLGHNAGGPTKAFCDEPLLYYIWSVCTVNYAFWR